MVIEEEPMRVMTGGVVSGAVTVTVRVLGVAMFHAVSVAVYMRV